MIFNNSFLGIANKKGLLVNVDITFCFSQPGEESGARTQPKWYMRWRLYQCKNAENIWIV